MLQQRWTESSLWYHLSGLVHQIYSQLLAMCWDNRVNVCTFLIIKCLVVMTCYGGGGGETFPCSWENQRHLHKKVQLVWKCDSDTTQTLWEKIYCKFRKYWKLQPSTTSIDEEEKDYDIDFLLQFSSASQLLLSEHCSLSEESAELSWHQVQDPVCICPCPGLSEEFAKLSCHQVQDPILRYCENVWCKVWGVRWAE